MKWLVLVALAGTAGASERTRLFPDVHVPEEAALTRVRAVVASCQFSEMSRIGPSPDDAARCNAAEGKLLELGQRAVPAVMQRLDGAPMPYAAMARLYDVMARAGGNDVIEPLVAALEEVDASHDQTGERGQLLHTLRRLTHVEGIDPAPFRAWVESRRSTQTAKAEVPPAS